eukprot:6172248-Pleurochrysis_carterae.AAC.1
MRMKEGKNSSSWAAVMMSSKIGKTVSTVKYARRGYSQIVGALRSLLNPQAHQNVKKQHNSTRAEMKNRHPGIPDLLVPGRRDFIVQPSLHLRSQPATQCRFDPVSNDAGHREEFRVSAESHTHSFCGDKRKKIE